MKKNYIYLIIIIAIIAIISLVFYFFKTNPNKISIGTGNNQVEISNILKDPIKTFPNSDVAYKRTDDYSFDYYAKDQLFIITITNPDIKNTRIKAENDFLKTLEITEDQACKLNIQLGVPYSINPDASGINYRLSFCPNGKPF